MDWRDHIRDPNCTLCPLHRSAQHVCLLGSGPRKARVMILGEAPGEREDAEHAAFVGPSGQLLRESLRNVGLAPEEIYISNVTKCRPPENRTPTRSEAKTCSNAYLAQELDAVQPSYVLGLGNAPLQALVGRSGITKHRGQALGSDPVFFATFHPAYVLRSPQHGPAFRADLQRFARLVNGEVSGAEGTRVKVIRTKSQLEWLRRKLDEASVIAFDVETSSEGKGKNHRYHKPWDEEGHIVCASFSWEPGMGVVLPLHHAESSWADPSRVLRFLKPALERPTLKTVAHNGKFDCTWMAASGVFIRLTFDTMLAAHILDENRLKGLKPLSQILLGVDAYDVGEDLKDAYNMPVRRLAVYAAKDVDYTLRLYHLFKPQLKEEPRLARVFAKVMMPASHALTKVETIGLWVDPDRVAEQTRLVEQRRDRVERKLRSYVPGPKRDALNFNSPQQVGAWLFGDLELPILDLTRTDAPSTAETVMLRLAKQHPAPALLLKYRGLTKNLNTYLYPWEEKRDRHSRIHTNYKLYGTVTGRLSSEKPNLQQVPRESAMRTCFGAPPGWRFLEADYSQIELRIAAMLARDPTLLRIFATGGDPHLTMAIETLGYELTYELAYLYQMWKEGQSTGTRRQVLQEVWDPDQAGSCGSKLMGISSKGGQDQEPRRRERGGSARAQEPILERRDITALCLETPEGLLRTLRKLSEFRCSPQGRESLQQLAIQPGNPMSFLSSERTHLEKAFPAWKELRKRAKAANFGYLYRMGAEKFVEYARDNYGVDVSLEEAQHVRQRFYDLYSRLQPWHDRQVRLAQRYQRVHSPIGRIRHLPDVLSNDRSVRAEAERQAINSPVQSFASDLMLLSMLRANHELRGRDAFIVGTVHDALLFQVRNEYVREAVETIRSIMEDMRAVERMFGVEMTVPIIVDIKESQYWGGRD